MAVVFLSYAREDLPIARQLQDCLGGEGWSVFWDRETPVGRNWEDVIERELSQARCIVVLWSTASIRSEWVRAEAAAAAERGVLVPALIDATTPPLRFRTIQTADLVDWHGGKEHVGLLDLIAAVRAIAESGNLHQPERPGDSRGHRSPARGKPIAIAEVETGEDRGKSLVLTAGMTSVTIGRSRDCDFVLDQYYVSRSHCRLQIQPSQIGSEGREQYRFTLIDFGSPAGTIVNGKRAERVDLHHGDHFQIGTARFRFRVLDEGAA